jgi:hypothetical protein
MPRAAVRSATALALLLLAAGPVLGAQATVVDEGTFSILIAGTRVGREDFSVRRARGTSGDLIAQANRLEGEERRTVALTTDSAGAPLRFQMETRDATTLLLIVDGERQRGVWSGRTRRAGGESARELRLSADTFVLEPGFVHHLWFLVRFAEGRAVTSFSPSELARSRVVIEEQAPDRVSLGLRELVARRWVVRDADSGATVWEIWTDPMGRLLRALNDGISFEAVRDDPPAETRPAGRS